MIRRAWKLVVLLLAGTVSALALTPSPGSWMTHPTPKPGDWMVRHNGFVAQAQAGGIDVLFIGDSITDGWRHMGLASWKKHFAPLRAANFGISGDGTHNVLWRLQNGELEGMKPRVVVLLIGTNNIPWTFDNTSSAVVAGQVTEAIQLLVTTIRTRQPDAHVLVHGILPRGEWANPSRTCIRQVNANLAALAQDRVHLVDLGDMFLEGDHLPPSVMPDFLHPNTRAYAAWAPRLVPAVKDLLGRQD